MRFPEQSETERTSESRNTTPFTFDRVQKSSILETGTPPSDISSPRTRRRNPGTAMACVSTPTRVGPCLSGGGRVSSASFRGCRRGEAEGGRETVREGEEGERWDW